MRKLASLLALAAVLCVGEARACNYGVAVAPAVAYSPFVALAVPFYPTVTVQAVAPVAPAPLAAVAAPVVPAVAPVAVAPVAVAPVCYSGCAVSSAFLVRHRVAVFDHVRFGRRFAAVAVNTPVVRVAVGAGRVVVARRGLLGRRVVVRARRR